MSGDNGRGRVVFALTQAQVETLGVLSAGNVPRLAPNAAAALRARGLACFDPAGRLVLTPLGTAAARLACMLGAPRGASPGVEDAAA